MKTHWTLILLRANIRKKKDKRTFVLSETNVYPQVSFNEGLYLMSRCGFPLYAQEGLNQASYVNPLKDIGCYIKNDKEIAIAALVQKIAAFVKKEVLKENDKSILIFPEEPKSVFFKNFSGSDLDKLVENNIDRINHGMRLEGKFVEEAIRKARLSLIPKGWEVVTDGNVEPCDRYLEEKRAEYMTITPAIVSWVSCDVSFSARRPGTPVKRYSWDDSIIIRKIKKESSSRKETDGPCPPGHSPIANR